MGFVNGDKVVKDGTNYFKFVMKTCMKGKKCTSELIKILYYYKRLLVYL